MEYHSFVPKLSSQDYLGKKGDEQQTSLSQKFLPQLFGGLPTATMAVGSGSVSNRSATEKKERAKTSEKEESKSEENGVCTLPPKRNKPAQIRVVGGRIYDSVNGKSCHQCRQKTMDFVATCTNLKNNKPCTIMYCHKCLLNRYGEKAEEVVALEEWTCPRCRFICNCSVCMKKRGHLPTGILINTAKATGFSSVSEMLSIGSERSNHEKVTAGSLKKEIVVPSPGKRGKENSLDGKLDMNLPNHADKKSKKDKEVQKGSTEDKTSFNIISRSPNRRKLKQEALENVRESTKKFGTEETGSCKTGKTKRDRSDESNTEKNDEGIRKETNVDDDEKKLKKSRKDTKKNDTILSIRTSPRKLNVSSNIPNQVMKLDNKVGPEKNMNSNIVTGKNSAALFGNGKREEENGSTAKNGTVIGKHRIPEFRASIPLPLGIEMNSVAGIDVHMDDMGNALQFLEFCDVFGKILEVRKGQAVHVLQDLLHGRTGRRGKFSLTIQCAKLSSSYGKHSWFVALKKCLSESQSILKAQGLDSLDKTADYETLETSEKLRLLNVLCDEVLETEKVRNWLDDQNTKLAEKIKEAKQKVTAAKDKEKSLKQKMKDDYAKAILAKHGAHLSISEHEAIVSDIKRKSAQAHAKVLESKGMLIKNNEKSDAVRIEPIFVGATGHSYWKLNCIGKSDILRQNAGKTDGTLTVNDKWYIINDEGKEAIDKLICL
ncbi:hypothetical protein OROGR_018092 [Orobanche gracilis]